MDTITRCDLYIIRYEIGSDGVVEPIMGIGLSRDKVTKLEPYCVLCIDKIKPGFTYEDDYSSPAYYSLVLAISRLQGNLPEKDPKTKPNYYSNQIDFLCQRRANYVYSNCVGEEHEALNRAFFKWKDQLDKAYDSAQTPEAREQAQKNRERRAQAQKKAFQVRFDGKREETIEFISEFISLYDLVDKPEVARFLIETPHLDDIRRYLKSKRGLQTLVDDERFERGLQLAIIKEALDS